MAGAIQSEDSGIATQYLEWQLQHIDLLFFPALLLAAWFYFPYCRTGPKLCLWRALIHTDCPGCGLTRGICYLVHGHIREALAFNRFSVIAFALTALNFLVDLRTLIWP
jgi:Protein of unknown function (DUF2752)